MTDINKLMEMGESDAIFWDKLSISIKVSGFISITCVIRNCKGKSVCNHENPCVVRNTHYLYQVKLYFLRSCFTQDMFAYTRRLMI